MTSKKIESTIDFNETIDSQLINIENRDGILVTSSRDIAEKFGKEHKNVLQSVVNLAAENSATKNMFVESYYINRGKEYPEYLLTRDGFSLLAMGFTGAKALKWKIKYIEAFNKMEAELRKQSAPTGKQLMAMALIEANETIENQVVLIYSLQKKIIKAAPKVSFSETLLKGEDVSPIGDFAKFICNEGFEIGRTFLALFFK